MAECVHVGPESIPIHLKGGYWNPKEEASKKTTFLGTGISRLIGRGGGFKQKTLCGWGMDINSGLERHL